MKTLNRYGIVLGTVAALGLGACATPTSTNSPTTSSNQSAVYAGTGVVQSIEVVKQDTRGGIGLGTVAGAVIGGVVGNQVGEGSGNTAATVLGAAGGAYAGNRIENSRQQPAADAYRITVRMDNGGYQSVVQATDANLRIGDRVRVSDGMVVRY